VIFLVRHHRSRMMVFIWPALKTGLFRADELAPRDHRRSVRMAVMGGEMVAEIV
jgi:hypothetical protein